MASLNEWQRSSYGESNFFVWDGWLSFDFGRCDGIIEEHESIITKRLEDELESLKSHFINGKEKVHLFNEELRKK